MVIGSKIVKPCDVGIFVFHANLLKLRLLQFHLRLRPSEQLPGRCEVVVASLQLLAKILDRPFRSYGSLNHLLHCFRELLDGSVVGLADQLAELGCSNVRYEILEYVYDGF